MASKLKKLWTLARNCGISCATYAIIERLNYGRKQTYEDWIQWNEKNEYEEYDFSYTPKISIVVPVYNVKKEQLIACIESVLQQTYSNVELCMSDDCSTMPEVREVLEEYDKDERVKVYYREKNGHISENTNSAIALATGEFIGFLDCDDFLAKNAVAEIVNALNKNSSLDFIYSDEDLVTEDGKTRFTPIFKPDWSPDTYLAHNYTNHFSVYRASIVKEIGGLRTEYNGSQDYDFVLRFTEHTDVTKIAHISKVLYHWRSRPESVASGNNVKPYVFDAAKRAKEEAMKRRGIKGHLVYGEQTKQWNVVYDVLKEEQIGILVFCNGNVEETKRTVDSIYANSSYEKFKICIVSFDAGLKEKMEQTFQNETHCFIDKTKCNTYGEMFQKHLTDCQYVVVLQAGIKIYSKDWLQTMLGHMQQADVGMVGAKICYQGNKVVSSSGRIRTKVGLLDAFAHFKNEDNLYLGLNHNYYTTSERCFMVKKELLDQISITETSLKSINWLIAKEVEKNGMFAVTRPDVEVEILTDMDKNTKYQEYDIVDTNQDQTLDPFYNKNFSQVVPFAIGVFMRSSKEMEKQEYIGKLDANILYNYQNDMFNVVGLVMPSKGSRSLWDKVWIEVDTGDTKFIKLHLEKKFLQGYLPLKKGFQWAEVHGCSHIKIEKDTFRFRICQKKIGKRICTTNWYEIKERG